MIKLIAADMDGTLLDSQKRLPGELPQVLLQCKSRGIRFFAASGRSYTNLKSQFEGFGDNVSYICDNGAVVIEDDKLRFKSTIDRSFIPEIVEVCSKIEDTHIILCGFKGFYDLPLTDEGILKEVMEYYEYMHVTVDDLLGVDDDFFKIAVYDVRNSHENSAKVLNEHFSGRLELAVSGEHWVDIMETGVSKGKALEFLQKAYGISKRETMVFGDFDNDIEMLKFAEYSFVMANADDKIKKYGNHIAKSNDDNGVIKAIREYAFI